MAAVPEEPIQNQIEGLSSKELDAKIEEKKEEVAKTLALSKYVCFTALSDWLIRWKSRERPLRRSRTKLRSPSVNLRRPRRCHETPRPPYYP